MNANELKRLAKLSDWKARVAECRSSGMSVREWCEGKGICPQTYYRWEKAVLAEASGQLLARNGSAIQAASSVPVFAELTPVQPKTSSFQPNGAVATVRFGIVEIDLHAGVEPGFIASLCKELQHAE